jgi:hypothetical protein
LVPEKRRRFRRGKKRKNKILESIFLSKTRLKCISVWQKEKKRKKKKTKKKKKNKKKELLTLYVGKKASIYK